MKTVLSLFAICMTLFGCAYPQHTIALNAVTNPGDQALDPPPDVWQFTVLSALIPPTQRSGLAWDEDGSAPDCVVRIYRDDQLIFETPRAENTLQPEWNVTLPNNLWTPGGHPLRFEIWDLDSLQGDPVGSVRFNGLPENALPDAIATLRLEGDATLQVRVNIPKPFRGCGILRVEERPSSLVVLAVSEYSPAGRAGIRVGDRVVKIDHMAVGDMGGGRATTALSMTGNHGGELVVEDAAGHERTVTLDRGFTWFTM